jgi:Mrp family chromosome partitioning ATPase
MKVTQPLGSFLPDGVWNDPSAGLVRSRTPQDTPNRPLAPRSPAPEAPASTYSYVSKPPPPAENTVAIVKPAPGDWRPDPSLSPQSRRPLCEQLYPLAVENCLIVLVVGVPESQEQKSRVAAELALALAESGHPRILLLEADLQGPHVHRVMNVDMPMGAGFSQQLRARINGHPERHWTVVGCTKTLHVLAEGMMRSPGLLLSQQFSDSLRELRNYYDIIVIDGPTGSLQVESQALDAVTQGVVFVCGKAGSPALAQLQSLFREKKIKTVVTSP